MGFTKFTKNVLNVSALPDRVQNQASSLKLVFDQAGVDIKAALNALISELEAKVAAANIGADVASVTEKNVQSILTAFENEIANRYTKAETNNAILADTNELIADVKIDLATGLLTVTKKNGTKQTFETSTEAESYAVGGTGTRPGEDTDNAKYYAQIAKQVAGGDFVTVVEMEGYAQKKGLYPNYNETELKGEVIETETTLEAESTLKLYGNSTQETRSGKNKININANRLSTNGATSMVVGNDIKVSATSSSSSYLYAIFEIPNSDALLGKTMTLSAKMIPSASNTGQIAIYRSTPSKYTASRLALLENSGSKQVTFPSSYSEEGSFFTIFLYANATNGTAVSGDSITYSKLQLEEGSTATSYEPYGASPSPEFESPIKSVSSKSDNLFDMDSWSIFDKQSDGSYKSNILVGSESSKINVNLPIDTYTLSYSIKVEAGANYRIFVYYKDGTYETKYVGSTGEYIYTTLTTQNKEISYINLSYTAPSENVYIKDFMFNKGTKALPYQPYGYVPVEARVEGKNLANEIVAAVNVGANNGVYTQKTADTKTNIDWKVEGRLQGTFIKSFARFVDHGLGVKTASFVKDASFDRIYIGINGSARDTLIYIPVDDLINGETYTVQWNVLNATQGSVSWNNVQLEKGATATPFVNPPKTISLPLGDIELRSTPDGTRDTFARVDGVWNKVNKVGSVVFDGGESWNYFSGTDGKMARVFVENSNFANVSKNGVRSNKFIGANYNDFYYSQGKKFCVALSNGTTGGANRLFFTVDGKQINITTVTEWDKWVASNPITVEYLLETPTYTPITDPALISALDELEQLILHKGYNRITVTGVNGVNAYLEFEISPTALTTNVTETEASTNMIVPVVSETGDVRVKIPATENQMTINPATGVVNVKGLTINGVSLDAYIRSIIG